MTMNLDRLLSPATVALVGGDPAVAAAGQNRILGFEGEVWLVNTGGRTVDGAVTFGSVADLPGPPDAALVAVGRDRVPAVVKELADLGAGGVVVYTAGFAEADERGRSLQEEVLSAAGTMPVIGPNCHGFLNALTGAALWPDVQGCHRVDRGVAIVTQSGNLAINLTMQQRALPEAMVVTLGNQAAVTVEDVVEWLLSEPRVTAIGLHIEGLRDPMRLGGLVSRTDKPVIALKSGRTDQGAAIARTHTASMAGASSAYDALFARYGVSQVETVPELLSTLAVLHHHGRLPGPSLVSMSCSGGEAGLVADRSMHHDVRFPDFPPDVAERLDTILDGKVAITNPFDYHTFIWGDRQRMTACFTEALAAPVDAGMLILDFPAPGLDDRGWWPTLESWIDAAQATSRPTLVASTLPENLPVRVADRLGQAGIPVAGGIDEALAALAAAALPRAKGAGHSAAPPFTGTRRRLDDLEARARLAERITVPAHRPSPIADAARVADALGYPVAVKAMGLDHKSELGGVSVGLRSPDEVDKAATGMASLGTTVLIERQITGIEAELVVAVRREPPVGWLVTLGAGGVLVEVLDDVAVGLAPLSKEDVMSMLDGLRISRLLDGHRGRIAVDRSVVAAGVVGIVEAALSHDDTVELEVNPLAVTTDGAWALDVTWMVER